MEEEEEKEEEQEEEDECKKWVISTTCIGMGGCYKPC